MQQNLNILVVISMGRSHQSGSKKEVNVFVSVLWLVVVDDGKKYQLAVRRSCVG